MFESNHVAGRKLGLIVVAVLSVAGAQAHAQEAAEQQLPSSGGESWEVAADDEAEQDAEQEEVIFITGSLLEQPSSLISLPLTIIDRDDLEAASLPSTGDVLQDLTSQGNAINTQFNNSGDGTTRVSLRGLGDAYTLVLVNGRRFVSGGLGADATVDLNSIPIHIIDRIEILKDSGSLLYGSGAVGGVVNIITRTDFNGVESGAYVGYNPALGSPIYDLSVGGGHRSERSNLAFHASYFDHPPLYSADREFSRVEKFYDWTTGAVTDLGSTATPEGYILDYGEDVGNETWQALMAMHPGAVAFTRDPETGWRSFAHTGNSDTGEGDYYNYMPEAYLIMPVRRLHLYSRAGHDLSEHVHGYAEAFYNSNSSSSRLAPERLFTASEGILVSESNYYNPFGRDFVDVRRRMVEAGPRIRDRSSHTLQWTVGLEGRLPAMLPVVNDWSWELSYGMGQNETISQLDGHLDRSRLAMALGPGFVDADGSPVCGTPSAPIDGCIPLNLFGGAGTITPEMLDYITSTGLIRGTNQLHQALLTASGILWGNRNGRRISAAFRAEYERFEGSLISDSSLSSGATTLGKLVVVDGDYDAREAYAELSAIPVVESPFARRIEMVGAARISSFPGFDPFTTWQVRGVWQSPFGLSLRGGYYGMFRTPSISDQANISDETPGSELNQDDRAQLPTYGYRIVPGPERGKSISLGATYSPWLLPSLSLELSYFHLGVQQRFEIDQSVPGCDAISEPTDLFRSVCTTGPMTSGVDFAARYRLSTSMAGALGLELEGTWLKKFDLQQAGFIEHGKGMYGLGMHPAWKSNLFVSWWNDEWELIVKVIYIGSFKECEANDCREAADVTQSRVVSTWSNLGLSLAYTHVSPIGTSKLTLGVSNLLDKLPPTIYNGAVVTSDASTYDFMGRFTYLKFEQRF